MPAYSSVFHTPSWRQFQHDCFGYMDRSATFCLPSHREVLFPCMSVGRRAGLFPDLRSIAGGYGGFGSELAPEDASWLWRQIARPCLRGAQLTVRSNPLQSSQPPPPLPLVQVSRLADFTHLLDLRPGFDELWRKVFQKEARNQYRKGIKEGVSVRQDSSPTAIDVYHHLHQLTSANWSATERRPLAFFQRLLRATDISRLWLAEDKAGQAIGGVVTLEHGGALHIWATARDAGFARLRPMDVLYTEIIRDGCQRGMAVVDFGSSLGLPSVQAFKEQYGPRLTPYDVWVLSGWPWRVSRLLARRR